MIFTRVKCFAVCWEKHIALFILYALCSHFQKETSYVCKGIKNSLDHIQQQQKEKNIMQSKILTKEFHLLLEMSLLQRVHYEFFLQFDF